MKIQVFPRSLRSVLALQVALPVLAVLAMILVVSLVVLGQFVENRMQRDLQLVARAIHLPMMQALARKDLAQLQSNLASVFSMGEVYGAYLFDGEGRLMVSFGRESPTRQQAGDAIRLSREGEYEQYEWIRGQNVYSFFLPLFDEAGRPDGLLQVTRLRSDIDRALRRLTIGTWAGFALAAGLIFLTLSMGHQRAIGRPLGLLVDSMQRIKSGEHGHRAEEQGPVELRQLARHLNEMLDAIRVAEARADAQRDENARIEAQLRRSETLAALGQLSAGVAHELGAPLSVVDGRARRLLRVAGEYERLELEEVREQVARMASIIEQLLAFARGSRTEHDALDVSALIQCAMALAVDEGGAPQWIGGPECHVRGDALGLELALVNLVRNAHQARPDGQVSIAWRREDGWVVVQVDDDGPGIPEADRKRIFEPFFTTKTPGEGTGLGLAIVHRVAREHGGEVQVMDSSSGGARFELWLPEMNEKKDRA